jgi:propionyl-CoA synthetase
VLKKQDPAYMKQHDLSSLRYLFLAGEPLDEPTARWAGRFARRADRRQLLADGNRLADPLRPARHRGHAAQVRQPSFPVYGYDVRLLHEGTGEEAGADEKAVLSIVPPLPRAA